MKGHMNSHILQERLTMFKRSADQVRDRHKGLTEEVKGDLDDKVDEIFIQMRRDYRSVLGGGDVPQDGQLLPKAQRLVRKEILRLIEGVEQKFNRVAGLEVEDDGEEAEEKMDPEAASTEEHESREKRDAEGQEKEEASAEGINVEAKPGPGCEVEEQLRAAEGERIEASGAAAEASPAVKTQSHAPTP